MQMHAMLMAQIYYRILMLIVYADVVVECDFFPPVLVNRVLGPPIGKPPKTHVYLIRNLLHECRGKTNNIK